MSASLPHNGCDTLMLGFDYELRRRGFAGNSCQIVLELSAAIDPGRLEQRLAEFTRQHPILCSRPARSLKLVPRWKPTRRTPSVRVHRNPADGLQPQLFNEPLEIHRGELIRFDLIERTLIFTWAHALMDAKSAEYFLALVGGDSLPALESGTDWYAQRAMRAGGLRARGRQAWRELERMDQFRNALPVSLSTHRQPVSGRMKYQVIALSAPDSARVRANATRRCGLFGETNYRVAATLLELHRLHQRAGCTSASYVVPIPIGLRPKGTAAPLFSNQVTMILYQFFPDQLTDMDKAVAAVKKTRDADGVTDDQLNAGITLAQMFRGLPLPLYMRMIKHELRGEICSLFFGDAGPVHPALKTFFGADINHFLHVPAITVPPGVGVVFYQFRDQLHFSLVHAEGTLTESEAAEFAGHLRERLLNP
jgi:hypothetical protein